MLHEIFRGVTRFHHYISCYIVESPYLRDSVAAMLPYAAAVRCRLTSLPPDRQLSALLWMSDRSSVGSNQLSRLKVAIVKPYFSPSVLRTLLPAQCCHCGESPGSQLLPSSACVPLQHVRVTYIWAVVVCI